jgi:Helicase HerA, central domain
MFHQPQDMDEKTMKTLDQLVENLGGHEKRFGVLAESNTFQLTVIAKNTDVAVGDLFLLPCKRGPERFYMFRTTQYANIMNRTLEMDDVARNKLTMPDSFLAKDLSDENLIELKGIVLGYAERDDKAWIFHRPRRLPEHLTDVYRVNPGDQKVAEVVRILMQAQLGKDGLFIGNLLAGETALVDVPVQLPPYALSHHIAIFGRTGCGKSNLIMVFLRSILGHNQLVSQGRRKGPRCSIFAIDPHDEFQTWHARSGGADGIRGIVESYTADERKELVEPFYYLTAKDLQNEGLGRKVRLSRADITPDDLTSTIELTDQQISFANQFYGEQGDRWITPLLMLDEKNDHLEGAAGVFHPGTISAVKRRLRIVQRGNNRIFTNYDPDYPYEYDSSLPDIICALEQGRVMIVDTTLMSEMEQFLLTTIVARVLFSLRKALRSADNTERLETEIRCALGNDDANGLMGMQALADGLVQRLEDDTLPYLDGDNLRSPEDLPYINVVIEEAPSVLNPNRIRFGSVFRDICRQGRKFGIGLTIISQQVTAIDEGILTQINTELTMALGNEQERRAAIRNASADLIGFERELQVMSKGQAIASASFRDIPLPTQAPDYDTLRRGRTNGG